jgi:hypothetical protein
MEEKKGTLSCSLQDLQNKVKLMNFRLSEILSQGKESAAQHVAAEILTVNEKICELKSALLQLQKEAYFTSLERKRKLGVKKKLQEELHESKQKQLIQKQIQEKVKKGGLAAALDAAQEIAAKIKEKQIKGQFEKSLSKQDITQCIATGEEFVVHEKSHFQEGYSGGDEAEKMKEEPLSLGVQTTLKDKSFDDESSASVGYAAGNAVRAAKILNRVNPPQQLD